MNQTIATAIRTKHLISFRYDTQIRVVEPHTYGINKKQNESLSAWQRTGTAMEQPDWRLYTVSKMSEIRALPESFANARQGYKRNDPRMTTIFEQI